MTTKIYTVKSGESLSKIARDVLGNMSRWKEIAFINGISYPYIIKVGQIIELPNNNETIEVRKKIPTTATPPVKNSNFSFSPATVKLLIAGAVLYLFLT